MTANSAFLEVMPMSDKPRFPASAALEDFGVTITDCRAKLGENVFRWSLENVDLCQPEGVRLC